MTRMEYSVQKELHIIYPASKKVIPFNNVSIMIWDNCSRDGKLILAILEDNLRDLKYQEQGIL